MPRLHRRCCYPSHCVACQLMSQRARPMHHASISSYTLPAMKIDCLPRWPSPTTWKPLAVISCRTGSHRHYSKLICLWQPFGPNLLKSDRVSTYKRDDTIDSVSAAKCDSIFPKSPKTPLAGRCRLRAFVACRGNSPMVAALWCIGAKEIIPVSKNKHMWQIGAFSVARG